MMNPELKKKIINTINTYEAKCDILQVQIGSLKNVINQFIGTSSGLNRQVDDHIAQFRKQLGDEFDAVALENKTTILVDLLSKLQKKKAEKAHNVLGLIKQSAESISHLAKRSQDKRAVGKLQQILDKEIESDAILVNFNQVLTQCVASVIKDLDELQTIKSGSGAISSQTGINAKINDSLQELVNHLCIPQNFDSKITDIKKTLEQKLTSEDLIALIDNLTALVIDSFNMEQNRIKGFLHQLTAQLQDFDEFFKSSSIHQQQASRDSMQLEDGIQDSINQIRNHLDTSKSIEELVSKVSQNLDGIGNRIQQYRKNEKIREKKLEQQVKVLQKKLAESQQNAEEIQNILSFQKHKINHDSLTALPNRESYDEHIWEAFARWKQSGKEFAIAFCDIDHFKLINDNFGHLAGDKVLRKIAELLRSSLRSTDFIARIGGEEFVIIFEDTSSKIALSILEKLRKLIEECKFYYRENKVDVTVSFGLTLIKKNDDIESLFIRADKAMYKAKKLGRNRVEIL